MILLGPFVLLFYCAMGAKDGRKKYLRTQSILYNSQNLGQNRSEDEQKSKNISSFAENTPPTTFVEHICTKSFRTKINKRGDNKTSQRTIKEFKKVADIRGKENKEKRFVKEIKEEGTKGTERRREKTESDIKKYNFKESEIGDSWLIGDDSNKSANAYVNYMDGCEETLTIPHTLTDEFGNTKKVEVIGQYAFRNCGDKNHNGTTHSIILSRYIKVIKTWGLGEMDDVTNFEIEEWSCLESIESYGLSCMSWFITNEDDRSGILVLPSTLTSVAERGLFYNNLIKTIYYCGSTHLSNYSILEWKVNTPEIKVTRSYTHTKIFGRYTPNNTRESITEAEDICNKYKPEATLSPSPLRSTSPTEAGAIPSNLEMMPRPLDLRDGTIKCCIGNGLNPQRVFRLNIIGQLDFFSNVFLYNPQPS